MPKIRKVPKTGKLLDKPTLAKELRRLRMGFFSSTVRAPGTRPLAHGEGGLQRADRAIANLSTALDSVCAKLKTHGVVLQCVKQPSKKPTSKFTLYDPDADLQQTLYTLRSVTLRRHAAKKQKHTTALSSK